MANAGPRAATPQAAAPNATALTPQLKLFVKVQLFLILACVAAEIFCHFVLHLGAPYDYPFLARGETFWDFILFFHRFRFFHRPEFFTVDPGYPFLYPAPVAVLYEVFFVFRIFSLPLFLLFILECFVVSAFMLDRTLQRRGLSSNRSAGFVAASLLLSYPLWFDIKQGNIEIGIWLFVALGVWAFCAGKGYKAAACFGIAGSMKIFPFVYLGLLIARRKYRETAFAVLVAFVTTVVSLWLLGGIHVRAAWRNVEAGVNGFRTIYVLHYRPNEIGFDHSLFALIKCCVPHPPLLEVPPLLLTAYLAIAAAAGIALYFLRIRNLPLINQVLCLSVASILLPPVSSDYTLMHLYIPWAMLVLFAQEQTNLRRAVPGLAAAFVLLAILFAPESEFIYDAVRFGGQLKAGALVALMFVGLRYSFAANAAADTEALTV